MSTESISKFRDRIDLRAGETACDVRVSGTPSPDAGPRRDRARTAGVERTVRSAGSSRVDDMAKAQIKRSGPWIADMEESSVPKVQAGGGQSITKHQVARMQMEGSPAPLRLHAVAMRTPKRSGSACRSSACCAEAAAEYHRAGHEQQVVRESPCPPHKEPDQGRDGILDAYRQVVCAAQQQRAQTPRNQLASAASHRRFRCARGRWRRFDRMRISPASRISAKRRRTREWWSGQPVRTSSMRTSLALHDVHQPQLGVLRAKPPNRPVDRVSQRCEGLPDQDCGRVALPMPRMCTGRIPSSDADQEGVV